MHIKNPIFIFLFFIFLFLSCNDEENNLKLRKRALKEITLPTKISILDYDTSNTEYLPDSLSKELNNLTSNNNSLKPQLQLNYDNKWAIGYKIKTDKDFDILVVEQGKYSKIRCLITISKKQPIKIISSIIVAIDNYKETKNSIESELWTSDITNDLLVRVNKQYEKIENNTNIYIDENIENNNVFITEDKFKILPDGKIEFIKKNIPTKIDSNIIDKKYQVVLIFMKKTEDESAQFSENWLVNNTEIQNICTENSVQSQYCYDNFESAIIKNSIGKNIDTLNIKNIIKDYNVGYIVAKNNKTPQYIPYTNINEILLSFSQYFEFQFIIKN